MSFFKKKEKPVVMEHRCPAEGCTHTTAELSSMKKHIEWKHPELAKTGESTAEDKK